MQKKIKVALAAAALLIFVLVVIAADRGTLSPIMASMYRIPHADKIAHFLLMGLLAFFVALAAAEHRVHRWLFLLSAVITLEEFSQMFIATRNFSWIDLLFSLLGVVCFGWWGARLAKPKSC